MHPGPVRLDVIQDCSSSIDVMHVIVVIHEPTLSAMLTVDCMCFKPDGGTARVHVITETPLPGAFFCAQGCAPHRLRREAAAVYSFQRRAVRSNEADTSRFESADQASP